MDSREVTVRICLDAPIFSYTFSCPGCDLPIGRPVDVHHVELLTESGSPITLWHLPDELFEPRAGAPLTHDDIIDFHQFLQRGDWLEQITAER